MKLPVKTRAELDLGPPISTKSKSPKAKGNFSRLPKSNFGSVSEIKRKSRELQDIILSEFTSEFSDLNIRRVMEKVRKEKPEQILNLAKAVLPKDINVEVEEVKHVPIIIPALTKGAENGN